MADRPSTLADMLWHRVKSLDVPNVTFPDVPALNVQSPWPAPPQNSLGNHLLNALPDVGGMARGLAAPLTPAAPPPQVTGTEDELTATLMQMPDQDLAVIYQSPERSGYVRALAQKILSDRETARTTAPRPSLEGEAPPPSLGLASILPSFDMPQGDNSIVAANQYMPFGSPMEPPPSMDTGRGVALSPVSPAMAQEVAPDVVQAMEQLPDEQKSQMLEGMVKMLDTLVVEGEAPAERQEAVSRSAGDQRSEQPAPTSAGPAKPEDAPDQRTLALAQVYEVAAQTGLLTPEALPFSKFVAGFDQLQGGGGQDDQMNRLLAKGEEKKAEFTEAPKEERKGPKISDMEDQMNQLAGYRNSNLGRTGA